MTLVSHTDDCSLLVGQWLRATWARLGFAIVSLGLVALFPKARPVPTPYFVLVIVCTVLSSFASTVQFVGVSAFHTQVADPLIGGTYMTVRFWVLDAWPVNEAY